MLASLNIVSLIVASLVSLIGVMANLFIVTLNLLDWAKRQSLIICDRIFLLLGLTSIFYQLSLLANMYSSTIWMEGHDVRYTNPFISQLMIWTGSSASWLTACLCVFYCVKIVDSNSKVLSWLKLRIAKAVTWMLLGSVLGSLVLSIPAYWTLPNNVSRNLPNFMVNSTADITGYSSYTFTVPILSAILPLLFCITSITLLLASLCRHTRRMKEKASGFSQPRLEAHYGAAKVACALLAIFIPAMFSECTILFSPATVYSTVICTISTCLTPARSAILILGNSKLKRVLFNFLKSLRK